LRATFLKHLCRTTASQELEIEDNRTVYFTVFIVHVRYQRTSLSLLFALNISSIYWAMKRCAFVVYAAQYAIGGIEVLQFNPSAD